MRRERETKEINNKKQVIVSGFEKRREVDDQTALNALKTKSWRNWQKRKQGRIRRREIRSQPRSFFAFTFHLGFDETRIETSEKENGVLHKRRINRRQERER